MEKPSVLDKIFILFIFFPYVGLPQFDSQPFPVIFSLVYILFNLRFLRFSVRSYDAFLWIAYFAAILIAVLVSKNWSFLVARGIAGYVGIPIFLLSSYIYLKKFGLNLKIVVIFNLIWIGAALVQLVFPDIFSSFVSIRTSSERGVTSLSPEPGFFSMVLVFHCFILLFLSAIGSKRNVYILIFVNIISIMFLAKSFLGVVYLSALFIFYIMFSMKKISILRMAKLLLIFLVAAVGYILLPVSSDTRISYLIGEVVKNPISLFAFDISAASRLSDIIFPPYAAMAAYLLPQGFDNYAEVSARLIRALNSNFGYYTGSNIIKSWHGSFLFELGFGYLAFFLWVIFQFFSKSRVKVWPLLFFGIFLFSTVPVAFPLTYLCLILIFNQNLFLRELTIEKEKLPFNG